MYSFLGKIAAIILKVFSKITVKNLDNLPKDTGFIIACNHIGWVDIVGLGVALLPRQIHFMAKKELFKRKPVAKFLTSLNAFPVDRKNPGTSSIKTPVKLLKEGNIVGIFPSGTRNDHAPIKRGAVTIANLAKVPIVPCAYSGPTNIKDVLKRKKINIIIGEPMTISVKGKEELLQKTDELSKQIHKLETEIISIKK
ncbi:lysophospholipid acyltransferase family protein [Caldifermentibacillus hisashii]|uniref:lysophospholipid acyltransferase family protein n=1 Tax=Caldifermentibacillus hisashii TaxID=996558 RepID=UPI003D2226D0